MNLASHLLFDGFQEEFDTAVVISNDSDLLEPIKIVRRELDYKVGILNPQKKPSRVLLQEADFFRQIRTGALSISQFPVTFTDSKGKITKPVDW